MKKSSTETKKVYLGFDVSQKSVEVYAVCGETTSKGSVSIKNDRNEIRNFLQKDFPDTAKVCVVMVVSLYNICSNHKYRQEVRLYSRGYSYDPVPSCLPPVLSSGELRKKVVLHVHFYAR